MTIEQYLYRLCRNILNERFDWCKYLTTLRRGSRGCYVMVLQDALSTLGYQTGSRIDGIFGARTEQALRGYQKRTSLRVDGVCGCDSWKKISTAVIGIGRTKTTID